jgi:hypothetical protein
MNDFKNTNYSYNFEPSMIRRNRQNKSQLYQSKVFKESLVTKSLFDESEANKYVTKKSKTI